MKFNKKMLWGTCGQVLFAIFVIIAMYAIGLGIAHKTGIGVTPSKGQGAPYWGLAVSGIVIAFVGIVFPVVSLFVDNKKLNFIMGWSTIIFDLAVFAVVTSYFGKDAHVRGTEGILAYNKGYLAGDLIFDIFGFGFAIAGLGISYKDNLLKLA